MSTRSDTPVFCDESGTRSAFVQWSARGAILLVLLLCVGLALTLDTQVRLPGLSRLLPSGDIGFGRPAGPATVAVPADPPAHPTVRESGLVATDTERGSTITSPTTAAERKAQGTTPPEVTTRPTRSPRAQATPRSPTPPAAEPTTGPQRQPPGQTKKAASPTGKPTSPADSSANGHGQGSGSANDKGNKPEGRPVARAAPQVP